MFQSETPAHIPSQPAYASQQQIPQVSKKEIVLTPQGGMAYSPNAGGFMSGYSGIGGASGLPNIPVYGAGLRADANPALSPGGRSNPMMGAPGGPGGIPVLNVNGSAVVSPNPVLAGAGSQGVPIINIGPGGQISGLPTLPQQSGKPGQPPYPMIMTPNGPAYIMSISPLNPNSTYMTQQQKPMCTLLL